MQTTIRAFKETDTDTLINVWYQSSSLAHPFLTADFMEQEKKNIREIYIPNTLTWVVTTDDQIDGFISMISNEVGAIFVHPNKHGQGLGKQLMDHVSLLHSELEVEVFKNNSIGRAFYDRYGFEQIAESVHEPTNQKLIRMKYKKQQP
ncbi:MAG: GNAT family N-acetyltransferase [Reichenbachiella sp.]|uniref:GNAT family N-acetyltransferase n=1 Tax=Reichenbachiella sp. TaxID=2184521 RepID=UPI00326348ED